MDQVKKVVFISALIPFLAGCSFRHADYQMLFHISGEVIDTVTNKPVQKVTIGFIDTGFDSVTAKKEAPKIIGESDDRGKIDLVFTFRWGRDEGLFTKKAPETFDLVFSKESYKSKRLSLRASDFSREDGKLKVFLDKIYLEPG